MVLMYKRLTHNEFIERLINVHGDKYDYSKVKYLTKKRNIIIICKKHGEFKQKAESHLSGSNCNKCNYELKYSMTTDEWIREAINTHGDKYDYSLSKYTGYDNHLKIICKKHGEFKQLPFKHLKGSICTRCSGQFRRNQEDFIKDAINIHGDKYDYSKVKYKKNKDKVIIICKNHGDFFQSPVGHLKGYGCKKCVTNYSKEQIRWLNFMQIKDNCHIQNAENGTEFTIHDTNYKADGYCAETNTIYEYHGDFWHGNPKFYKPNDINRVNKKFYGELYNLTCIKENRIKDLGYNLVTIWESQWLKFIKCIKILQKKYKLKNKNKK